jgi:hypothetical protein
MAPARFESMVSDFGKGRAFLEPYGVLLLPVGLPSVPVVAENDGVPGFLGRCLSYSAEFFSILASLNASGRHLVLRGVFLANSQNGMPDWRQRAERQRL